MRAHTKAARKRGYRSGSEQKFGDWLTERGITFEYETIRVEWEDLTYRTYKPDFILPNNIIIEYKGRLTSADRRKHVKIKQQHPQLEIRFVFDNSRKMIYKGSKTTYAQWCVKHGFRYADKVLPEDWVKEKKRPSIPAFVPFAGRKVKRTKDRI